MWSSRQQTPVLSTPASGCSTPRPWGEPSGREAGEPRALTDSCTSAVDTRKGFVSLGPLAKIGAGVGPRAEIGGRRALDPASTKVDEMLKQDQQQQAQPTSSSGRAGRSRRRAVLSRVRRLLSRSRSASVEPPFARLDRGPTARDKAPSYSPRLLDVESPLGRPARISVAPVRVARKVPPPGAAAGVRARSDRVENFHRALDNELVSQAFGEFCKKTLSSENVEFVRQVRELDQLSVAEGTTAGHLREKLSNVADAFVRPESATEVNVKGSTREDVLCSIQCAIDSGTEGTAGGGESPWARMLAVAATEALVYLARDVHVIIFDGLWPRFLRSDEFALMMNTEEMRTVGFMDLDGTLIVSALPPQDPVILSAKKRELSRAFSWRSSREWREGKTGVSKTDLGIVEAAAVAADVAASTRPPLARRYCRPALRAAGASGKHGHAFGGLPRCSVGGAQKDARFPNSTMASPSRGVHRVSSSSSRRAFSLR